MDSDAGTTTPARNQNLELKVRVDESGLAAAVKRLRSDGVAILTLRQVDTYFAAARGRLKLRRIEPAGGEPSAELIAYARPDVGGPRWSTFHRVPVAVADAPVLAAALAEALGVRVVVAKTRRVGVLGRTRVHLDAVDGLGAFVELETVVGDGPAAGSGAEAELAAVAARLGLDPLGPNVVAGSYADLLLAAGGRGEPDPAPLAAPPHGNLPDRMDPGEAVPTGIEPFRGDERVLRPREVVRGDEREPNAEEAAAGVVEGAAEDDLDPERSEGETASEP